MLTIDRDEEHLFDDPRFAAADVAIEFTAPAMAYDNCRRAIDRGVPVVSGDNGGGRISCRDSRERCEAGEGTLFWSSNYSIGVQLFLQINRRVAELMQAAPGYRLSLDETHHIHKLDAPSGTAITLAETILAGRPELHGWGADG